jgi:hypothetical protein
MRTKLLVLAVGVVAAAACKGETVIQPDPATETKLANCEANQTANKKLIETLQSDNARLQTSEAKKVEVAILVEGDVLKIRPGKAGDEPRPAVVSDKLITESTNEFLALVRRSRGGIQKCYEQALKKSSGLQSRGTITLQVSAKFLPTGAFKSASFQPSLGDVFDTCMQAIASNWKLNQPPPVPSFQAPVTLTPS